MAVSWLTKGSRKVRVGRCWLPFPRAARTPSPSCPFWFGTGSFAGAGVSWKARSEAGQQSPGQRFAQPLLRCQACLALHTQPRSPPHSRLSSEPSRSSAELSRPGGAGGGSVQLGPARQEWLRCPGRAGGPAMGSGRRCSLLLLLLLLLLLELPAAWGDCGPLPNISHAEPRGVPKEQQSFSVGSTVTFGCAPGYTRLPFLSDTIQCLPNSRWSSLPDFCGRSCPRPPAVPFAAISPEDQRQNFYAVNTTVRYICRQGFENTTEQPPTSTCLDNLTWTAVPTLCHKKSCGIPANPEHGQVTIKDHLLGATANVVCDRGYGLKGASPSIRCVLQGDKAVWSPLPACQVISCPPPPAIPHGQHSGSSSGQFVLGSVTAYSCEPGLELVGQDTLRCTPDSSGDSGTWSGAPPACRVKTTAETNQTKTSEENPYWLAGILIPSCIVPPVVLGILAGIIMRRKESEKHSYNVNFPKHEMRGRGAPTHPGVAEEKEQPRPWDSYFCHAGNCHVCPSCEQQLHAALAPLCEPAHHGCPACQGWLSSQPQKPRSYSVPSLGDGDRQSPAGTRSPAKAEDVLRENGTGEAAACWGEAEQPMGHQSDHICPICESWLRAHTGQGGGSAVTPGAWRDPGPPGPVCPPCTDRQLLSLIQGDTASSPVCPLAREGTPAHLVPPHSPGCHVCPECSAPSHAHLCQPQRLAAEGRSCAGHPEHPGVPAEGDRAPQAPQPPRLPLTAACFPLQDKSGSWAATPGTDPALSAITRQSPDFAWPGKEAEKPNILQTTSVLV